MTRDLKPCYFVLVVVLIFIIGNGIVYNLLTETVSCVTNNCPTNSLVTLCDHLVREQDTRIRVDSKNNSTQYKLLISWNVAHCVNETRFSCALSQCSNSTIMKNDPSNIQLIYMQ